MEPVATAAEDVDGVGVGLGMDAGGGVLLGAGAGLLGIGVGEGASASTCVIAGGGAPDDPHPLRLDAQRRSTMAKTSRIVVCPDRRDQGFRTYIGENEQRDQCICIARGGEHAPRCWRAPSR